MIPSLLLAVFAALPPAPQAPSVLGAPGEYRDIVVVPEPGGRMVSAAFRFPAGPAMDPHGEEGTAFLLGRVLEREVNRRLLQYSGRVEVETERDELLVLLLVPSARWSPAIREVHEALLAAPLSSPDLEATRQELLGRLQFERDAPVRAFERERTRLVLGALDPGAREPRGSPATLEALTVDHLERFRSEHLDPEDAVVAVTGPVEPAEVAAVLPGTPWRAEPWRARHPGDPAADPPTVSAAAQEPTPPTAVPEEPDTMPPADGPSRQELPPGPTYFVRDADAPPLRVPLVLPGPMAWEHGDRFVLDRQLTSTWMVAAYPFPPGTPPVLMAFLAHLIYEALTPTPPDPGLFEADVRVDWIRAAPVLVLSVSADPSIAARWEERLTGALEVLAETPPTGSFFELTRRRFRSARLMELASPEARARWITRRLTREGGLLTDLEREIWGLDEEGVAQAAAAAGPPRILLFGPRDMMER